MEIQELLRKVRRIELKTRGLSDEIFSGAYHSAFKGKGMSYSEVRPYQYGDDVRSIDWNVTARTSTPHVKIFEEDRELTVILAIDCSQSMQVSLASKNKQELIAELCAVLSFSGLSNQDKVGAVFFGEQVLHFIPPAKGHFQTLRIVRDLLDQNPRQAETRIDRVLDFLSNVFKQRSICFLLSDFWSPDYQKSLVTAARRHDLIGIHVFDPLESLIPSTGFMRLQDPETGAKRWIDTGDGQLLAAWRKRFEQHSAALDKLFARTGADLIHLDTEAHYVRVLQQFFQRRRKSR